MGLRSLIGVTFMALAFVFVGCDSDKAQKVEPETRGKRNEICQARNDCDEGLACLNGVCSKNEFDIDVSVKQCDRIECSEDKDCCGDRPTKAPTKCKNRDVVCSTPQLPGCVQTSCVATGTCEGGGTCGAGTCNIVGGTCMDADDCLDTCAATGFCTKNAATACLADTDCPYYQYNAQAACNNRVCNCANPEYDPGDPICTDEECEDICLLRCQDELCLKDNSCETASDCVSIGLQICDDGRCVQCIEDADCDEDASETCEKGFCHKPCEHDEECGLFEACDAGDCVYVGCHDDKECILAAARGQDGIGGTNGGISSGGDDPRLFKCLASEANPELKTCKIPCENDGSCGQFQVCNEGYCKFIGCETNEQCRAYLGISNQQTSEVKPFVATAVCRTSSTAAAP
jgi:hypothetical protein